MKELQPVNTSHGMWIFPHQVKRNRTSRSNAKREITINIQTKNNMRIFVHKIWKEVLGRNNRLLSVSESGLLYDWRFTTSHSWRQHVLRLTTINFFQLNTCGYSPYVTSSLRRWWVYRSQLLLAVASAVIPTSGSHRSHDHILLSQIRDSPTWRVKSRIYIPQEQGCQFITPGIGFPFRRLLRLAGISWRNTNPPPYSRCLHSYILSIWYDTNHIENTASNSPSTECVFIVAGTYRAVASNGRLFWLHCSGFQALGGDTQTHWQQGNLISFLSFFEIGN
jgi:hypothetical protein